MSFAKLLTLSKSDKSKCINSICLVEEMEFNAFLALCLERPAMITCAPCFAKCFAVSSPIPAVPPVIIATFPDKSLLRYSWGQIPPAAHWFDESLFYS